MNRNGEYEQAVPVGWGNEISGEWGEHGIRLIVPKSEQDTVIKAIEEIINAKAIVVS